MKFPSNYRFTGSGTDPDVIAQGSGSHGIAHGGSLAPNTSIPRNGDFEDVDGDWPIK